MALEQKAKATKDEVVGKTKEVVGDVTGDSKLKAEGETQGFLGKARDAIDDVKEKIEDKVEDIKDDFDK